MKKRSNQIRLGIFLIVLSALTYYIHFLIFRDPHHIFIYLIGDIAFVFIEVLLVTIIIHQLLETREKKNRLEKLNMVIGIFFSELGTELLTYFSDLDPMLDKLRQHLIVKSSWTNKEFSTISNHLKQHSHKVQPEKLNLEHLRTFLVGKRDFMLSLMENPNLMEHERFTELLRAVFHLAEELKFRGAFSELPESDLEHIAGDINRVYGTLVYEWLAYMQHLKDNFPYFFSLAMRTNPFDQSASVVVE
ncbi:MAG: hypothetical protein JW920_07315 [Deltaproteobacteria bacterium]|nr:hypothetical protein [Deltaproteobacteria bacterium]